MKMLIFKIAVLSICMKFVFTFNNFANVACGKRSSRTGKIVGGNNAISHEFPWIVSLHRRGSHFCGGTLITDTHVLTAGHCLCTGIGEELISSRGVKVAVAQHDLEHTTSNTFEMEVNEIITHPEYSCKKTRHDLAVVILNRKVQWSENIIPACLPAANNENKYNRFSNAVATVAGWGWTNENRVTGSKSKILQKAKVNIFDNEVCQIWYKSQGKKTKIQESQICAGYEEGKVDSCWADSGGPLMVQSGDRFMVVGVVSTGIGCARPRLPGLYTRISEYVDWIRSTIRS